MSFGKLDDGVVFRIGKETFSLPKNRGQGVRTNVRNSSRVLESSRKPPNMAEVTVLALIFWTPRMTMHICLQWVGSSEGHQLIIPFLTRQIEKKYLRGFDYDADSVWLYGLTNGQCNLFGQPLLDL